MTNQRITLLASMPSVAILMASGMAPQALGQQELWSKAADATKSGTLYGWFISPYRDENGNGLTDVLIGEPNSSCDGVGFGIVHAVAGDTGADLYEICGTSNDPGFGEEVVFLDDVDGDGVGDIAFGAGGYDDIVLGDDTGKVIVMSGADLAVIHEIIGELGHSTFGASCAAIDDLNGDGIGEILIGAPAYGPYIYGAAYVYSGADGTQLRSVYGDSTSDGVGSNVARVGDVDLDGTDDYAIASALISGKGRVIIYSGAGGNELFKWKGANDLAGLGLGICDATDMDRDGHPDVLVSAGYVNGAGIAYCYSGATGLELFELVGDRPLDTFCQLAVLGDMNADSYPELLIGASTDDRDGDDAGAAFLFSGKSLRPLYRFYPGYQDAGLGWRVGSGADLDGDSIPDGLIGVAAGPKKRGTFGPSSVFAFAGNDLFLQATDTEIAEGDTVTLDTRGGEPGALTLLVLTDISGTPTFTPMLLATLDAWGEAAMTAVAPTGSSGLDFTFLAVAQRRAGGHGLVDSSTETIAVQ